MDILHVYYGTPGNAGDYLKAITDVLGTKYTQALITNYYYPYEGHRVFFKWTERSGRTWLSKSLAFRPIVRFAELVWGYCQTLNYAEQLQPRLINFSLIDSFRVTMIMLKALRRKCPRSTLVVTAHDVIPFRCRYQNHSSQMKTQQEIFNIPDFILVHNRQSRLDLETVFKVPQHKVVEHPFPIMGKSKMDCKFQANGKKDNDRITFLCIGHLRKEKGLQVLVDAWAPIAQREDLHLIVAGNPLPEARASIDHLKQFANVTVVDRYLGDEEYFRYLREAHYVVLPYLRGTNSGVASTAAALGKPMIVTEIPLFLEYPFTIQDLIVKPNAPRELTKKIEFCADNHKQMYPEWQRILRHSVATYEETFISRVFEAYRIMLR